MQIFAGLRPKGTFIKSYKYKILKLLAYVLFRSLSIAIQCKRRSYSCYLNLFIDFVRDLKELPVNRCSLTVACLLFQEQNGEKRVRREILSMNYLFV